MRPSEIMGVEIGPARFEVEVARTLGRLRDAIVLVLEALPRSGGRAADLRRELNLDAALAWQIHTLANADDVLRAGPVVPKSGAMERFIRAARERVGDDRARACEEAYQGFERLVQEHAGDRGTLDAMVTALTPRNASSLQRMRKAAFKANAAVWGVTCRATLRCVVYHERPTGEHDSIAISGRVGLRRLHQDTTLGLYASGRTWGGASCPPEGAPDVSVDECELLEEHCSQPMPRVERIVFADGSLRDFLQCDGLGKTSEVSLFWRNTAMNFPGGTRTPPHGCTCPCLEPTELMVIDLLLPSGWCEPSSGRVWVTPESARYPNGTRGASVQMLPFEGKVEYLGTRLTALHARQSPGYAGVVAHELERMGWGGTTFDVFRCSVQYPVLFSAIHVCVER